MGYSIKIKVINDQEMISKEIERISKQFSVFNSPLAMITENTWRPPTDVYETHEKIVIKIEVAGVKPDNLEIKLINQTIIVTGARHDSSLDKKIHYKLMEINYGYFEKLITLSDEVDLENVYCTYDNGFIEIGLPKKKKLKF